MRTLAKHRGKLAAFIGAVCASLLLVTSLVWADVPQPVLKITALGSNHFSITITNAVTNVNYELYWQPVLNDPNYPWLLLDSGELGETNWTVDGTGWQSSLFRVSIGNDTDGDGVLNWMDANPNNAAIGALTITIDSPANGSSVD